MGCSNVVSGIKYFTQSQYTYKILRKHKPYEYYSSYVYVASGKSVQDRKKTFCVTRVKLIQQLQLLRPCLRSILPRFGFVLPFVLKTAH